MEILNFNNLILTMVVDLVVLEVEILVVVVLEVEVDVAMEGHLFNAKFVKNKVMMQAIATIV
jgi:hypothetical protein